MLALVPVPTAPVGGAGDEHAKYAALLSFSRLLGSPGQMANISNVDVVSSRADKRKDDR